MVEERCADCRFMVSENNNTAFFCRRFPPTAFLMMGSPTIALSVAQQQPQPVPVSSFPPTARLGWCGEFQRKMEGNA